MKTILVDVVDTFVIVGVTRERVRQIEAKALEKIQAHGGMKKLKDY